MAEILLIEGDEKIAQALKRRLEEQGYFTTLCNDGFTAKKLIAGGQFDLVIAEIIIPGSNGIELCRLLKKTRPAIPMIITTTLPAIEHKMEAFDAGADDYLVKPFDFRELHARIILSSRRQSQHASAHQHILKYADVELNTFSKYAKRANTLISLTPKEFHLLEYLLNNPERVISRTEIADKVWNTQFNTGTNFIDVYINYLRRKIDSNFPEKLIHTRTRMGFVLIKEQKLK